MIDYDYLLKLFQENNFTQAGLITAAFSFVCYTLIPKIIRYITSFKKYLQSSVTLDSQTYKAVLTYVEEEFFDKILIKNRKIDLYSTNLGYGSYFCLYMYRPCFITKSKIEQQREHYDQITITIYFYWNLHNHINQLLKIKKEKSLQQNIDIIVNREVERWSIIHKKRSSAKNLITQNQQRLYDLLNHFSNNSMFDSCLLYGPPGNGKTQAVINSCLKLGLRLEIFSINQLTLQQDLFGALFSNHEILLIEDIDRIPIFCSDENNEQYKLTKSAILNFLDGALKPDNKLIIMTTNNLDKLDPAVIRMGRVNHKIEFNNPTLEEAKSILGYEYSGSLAEICQKKQIEKMSNPK